MNCKSTTIVALLCAAVAIPVGAQENLLANKPIHTLGAAKTWTAGDVTYTFETANLSKLVAVPTNTDNVFLFPENATLNTPENQAIGIQGFYVDMESQQSVKTVTTTWEGAAANSYDIYLTDSEPTLAILETTPTYTASGLGQYQDNVAVMPDGAKGRYLVFQPTDATNYGWGVKIRSIAAVAPAAQTLTTFQVQPTFVVAGEQTNLTVQAKDQFGLDMDVTLSVEGGTLDNGVLTVTGTEAVVTATAGSVSMSQTVYAVSAPEAPAADDIVLPIYTNTNTAFNGTAGFVVAYNGGATELGRLTFANGEVAAGFGNTRCVFIYNNDKTIMGGWDADIDPSALNLGALHMDIFGTKDVTGNVVFERTTVIGDEHPISIKAGQWNHIEVSVVGETVLHTISVRFDEANASDIVLSNIYFSALVNEDDVTAPVLGEVSVAPEAKSAVFSLTATDESARVFYTITVNGKEFKASGTAGETVECTVDGLTPATEYTASIVVSDGKNVSEPKEVKFTTAEAAGAPVTVPVPELPADDVISLFGSAYPQAITFNIGGWGQTTGAEVVTIDGKEVYKLVNFNYLGWEFNGTLNVSECTHVHVDFYTLDETPFGFTPISPGQEKPWIASEVKVGQWNSYDVALKHWSNVNFEGLFQFKFDQGNGAECYITNVYFWKDENAEPEPGPGPEEGNGLTYYAQASDTYEQTMEGVSKEYPYTVDYSVTYNEDRTLTIKATFNWTNGEPVGIVAGSVFVNNQLNDFALVEGERSVTTSTTYNSGDELPLQFYLPVANGVVSKTVNYVVGDSNSKPSGLVDVVTAAAAADGRYYDLQGRVVANPRHGLYIHNGRKVFVK